MVKKQNDRKRKLGKQSKPGCYVHSDWRVTLRVSGIWSQLWQQQQLRKARSRESERGEVGSHSLYTGKARLMELKDDTDVSLWPSQPSVRGNRPSHTGPRHAEKAVGDS